MDFRDFAITVANQAGEIIRTHHKHGMHADWKDNDTPLTVTDTKINQLVIDEIEKVYPEHSIIAEEGNQLKKSDYMWICDPIDGTVPFSHGWPTSVFALALTKNSESILGVIYDPYMERMVVAEKGKGAFLNGKRVQVSKKKELRNSVVDIELWIGQFMGVNALHEILINQYCHTSTIRSMSYGAMLVACGEIVAMLGNSPHPWDGAAAKIIVEEAGGKVTDFHGNEQMYTQDIKGVIATNGLLHEELLKLIKPHI
jgi:myo-inositol-1(or 4)-monophosphatase